jgi:hypothetical protein
MKIQNKNKIKQHFIFTTNMFYILFVTVSFVKQYICIFSYNICFTDFFNWTIICVIPPVFVNWFYIRSIVSRICTRCFIPKMIDHTKKGHTSPPLDMAQNLLLLLYDVMVFYLNSSCFRGLGDLSMISDSIMVLVSELGFWRYSFKASV